MEGNQLFPAFIKLSQVKVLIVGAGEVGWEKVSLLARHISNAQLKIVAPEIKEEIRTLIAQYPSIELVEKEFQITDLEGVQLVIAATAIKDLNREVYQAAKEKKILINVADTPELCDFYLSSVVKKGDLKIAISTNGKSPTLGKRIKELLQEAIPEETNQLLERLQEIRNELVGDFEEKVKQLDEITEVFKKK